MPVILEIAGLHTNENILFEQNLILKPQRVLRVAPLVEERISVIENRRECQFAIRPNEKALVRIVSIGIPNQRIDYKHIPKPIDDPGYPSDWII